MKQSGRAKRVAELVRHEIADLLAKGLKDPRIGFVSIMDVRMSTDLCYANVYVSLFGSEEEQKSSLIGLQRSTGWIRRQIGQRIRLRVTPEIRFFHDDTLEQVYHLEDVFRQIHEEEKKAPMLHISLEEVVRELREAASFIIISHQNPDGDAVGSVLGMRALLLALGKKDIHCVMEDTVPRRYSNLPGAACILQPEKAGRRGEELAIVLDCATLDRTGTAAGCIDDAARVLVIDHHLEDNPDGAVGLVDASYAATGEIIAELFDAAGVEMNRDAAWNLYVALATDTGGFRFSNTSPRSHRIAAAMIESGIDVAAISSSVFDVITKPKFELLRLVLERMQFQSAGRLAWTSITKADLASVNAHKEDLDGLVNYTRYVDGVSVGILFNQVSDDITKVSFRSDDSFNSAQFLQDWGGGGHAAAAGATIEKPMEDLVSEMVSRAAAVLDAQEKGNAT